MLHSISQQIWKTQQWPQDWKRSDFIPVLKRSNARECVNYRTIALISHASKVMLNILQARLQSTWTKNFQMFNLDLEKTAESEIKLSTSVGLLKKKENTRKTSAATAAKSLLSCPTLCDPNDGSPPGFPVHLLLLYWLCQSLWLCRSQQTVENSSKRWEYQTIWPASWEICMQVKKQQLELDIEPKTSSKLGKEYFKAVYCHPAYLTYM